MRTACLLVGVLVFAGGMHRATASTWSLSTTLHALDSSARNDAHNYRYDRAVTLYEPASGITAKGKLVVILSGHTGPDATHFAAFQAWASSLGFHSVALDYDYQFEVGADASLDPGDVCGCYDDCYGQFDEMISDGSPHAGIPPSKYPLKDRIHSVIHDESGRNWENLFFANGDIDWSKIVLVGLSRGGELAARIAKFNKVDRLLTFSGPNSSLSDVAGSGLQFPNSFGYGVVNGLSYCTPKPLFTPIHVITDNSWTSNGTVWKTKRDQTDSQMFTWLAEANTVSWDRTLPGVQALGLDVVGSGHALVGSSAFGENTGWDAGDSHFLSANGNTTTGFVCPGDGTQSGIHVSMLSGDCSNGDYVLRNHVWTYMLTH